MTINEHIIKLSGSAAIIAPLTMQKDLKVAMIGEIRAITDVPNDDGTINRIYRFRVSEIKDISE